jgi:hypothetical protein
MYYLLETDDFREPAPYRTRSLVDDFSLDPSEWMTGHLMQMPAEPMRVELWKRGGDGMAEMFLDSIPLFRRDLVQTLQHAGVDNLQICPAILRTPDGDNLESYWAVNIVGAVACADMQKSEYNDITGTGMIAVGFRKLVIDPNRANDLVFFRLAQSVASIVVHERVKQEVDRANYKYLSWRALQ